MLICLDTSWSMSTAARKALSKTVVLECVRAAQIHNCACVVWSFSNQEGVKQWTLNNNNSSSSSHADEDNSNNSNNNYHVLPLLDFLSHSYIGGGTDVTGALKRTLESLEEDDDNDQQLDAADVLLVTDGEIPTHPWTTTQRNACLGWSGSVGWKSTDSTWVTVTVHPWKNCVRTLTTF